MSRHDQLSGSKTGGHGVIDKPAWKRALLNSFDAPR